MLAAGLAALVATLVSWMMTVLGGGVRPAWAASIEVFGLEIALTFLSAAIGASVLMPRTADMTRPIRHDEEASAYRLVDHRAVRGGQRGGPCYPRPNRPSTQPRHPLTARCGQS